MENKRVRTLRVEYVPSSSAVLEKKKKQHFVLLCLSHYSGWRPSFSQTHKIWTNVIMDAFFAIDATNSTVLRKESTSEVHSHQDTQLELPRMAQDRLFLWFWLSGRLTFNF